MILYNHFLWISIWSFHIN